MAYPLVPDRTQPCVWMSAGLVNYKLCDRDFDCDRCPLDAGLRGAGPSSPHHEALLAPSHQSQAFPNDRRYTRGHTWLRTSGEPDRRARFGLDAFAAAIIGQCVAVSWNAPGRTIARGETICQFDLGLGTLSVGAPCCCTIVAGNPILQREPSRLVTSPYDAGWLVDLVMPDSTEPDGLMTAEAARQSARLDLQRFRRRVAMQLFAQAAEGSRTMQDGSELLVDLRQMLGGPSYLRLLQELIH